MTTHRVQAGRIQQNGWLIVDNQTNVTASSRGRMTGLNTFSPFYLGGYDTYRSELLPATVQYDAGFTGRLCTHIL